MYTGKLILNDVEYNISYEYRPILRMNGFHFHQDSKYSIDGYKWDNLKVKIDDLDTTDEIFCDNCQIFEDDDSCRMTFNNVSILNNIMTFKKCILHY